MAERIKMNYDPMDEKLERASQQAIRSVVKGLPEDTLSMAWRSALNEKILAEAAVKPKGRSVVWFLRPALGLGLACTLAVVVLFRGHGVSTNSSLPNGGDGLEAALMSVHQQTTLASDVAGVGLSPVEMVAYASPSSSSNSASATPQWSEADLDSL